MGWYLLPWEHSEIAGSRVYLEEEGYWHLTHEAGVPKPVMCDSPTTKNCPTPNTYRIPARKRQLSYLVFTRFLGTGGSTAV